MVDERASAGGATKDVILVIDDAELTAHQVRSALRAPEREILIAHSGREGLSLLYQNTPDLIVVSLELPDLPGPRALSVFQERAPGVPVVALSSTPTIEGAVSTVQSGAVDYLAKPIHARALDESATRALRHARTSRELVEARATVRDRYGFSNLLTRSPRMLRVFDQVRAVATTDATVLILGETGTGKELISRAIHERSRRRDETFIGVNCGAFPESLLESELFGHEKGSFTGAAGRRKGVFEMADKGTLFLDELGETSLNVQVSLLRVLEEMAFRRVGGVELTHVDVRVLAATNVNLLTAVRKGEFREDLYYRLDVFPIHLPPLRERREDIPLLIRHFLDDASQDYKLESPEISPGAMDAILNYRWPGNVRQLRALCERWLITRAAQRLDREHLPHDMTGDPSPELGGGGFAVDDRLSLGDNSARAVAQVERSYLHNVLKQHRGHMEASAKAAGITRRTLYTKMKLYGLDPDDYREGLGARRGPKMR